MSPTRPAALLLLAAPVLLLASDAKPLADVKRATVIDAAGKEFALQKWKVTGGVRKLAFLEGDAKNTEAFELREIGSTTFREGIVTLVPLRRIEAIEYDYDKQMVSVRVAGLEKPLQGTTKFKDINTITLEAEVDQGNAGVAELRYRGGVPKGGIRAVRFAGPKAPEAPPKGEVFSLTVPPEGKGQNPTVQQVTNLQALYRTGGGVEKRLPYLIFKKTLKVELANVRTMHVGDYDVKARTAECEVELKDGSQLSVTLLTSATIDEKPAALLGLIGEVPAGYKLFPIHTVTDWQPGEVKAPEPKEVPKKEPKKGKEDKP